MGELIYKEVSHYHILELLDEGGMAEVYKAVDLNLDREVAIKFLRTDPKNFEKSRKRFELEAKALAKLDHPNIVRVMDYGDYEGRPYLVMEYVPGGTLKQRLGKPMPWKQACALLIPIAEALQYAHERKIIHRDVKPSNILLKADGTPMLSDFGVAKILEMDETMDLTGTSVGVGTPYYMAPEQGKGANIDHRVDIYALGVVLYELITGKKPFDADTPLAVLFKHVQDPLPRPSKEIKGLPIPVERLLFKALAKESNQRFSSMRAFINSTEKILEGKEVKNGFTISRKAVYALGVLIIIIGLFFTFRSKIDFSGMNFQNREEKVPTESTEIIDDISTTANKTLSGTIADNQNAGGEDCGDTLGCVPYSPGEPIKIASALYTSDQLGIDSQHGVEIAIDFKGDVLGHPVDLIALDEGCSAEGGQVAGLKIVSDPKIIAVIGSSCSGAGVPMSKIISEAGYVMISPSNTVPALTDPEQAWNPGYLRISYNDKVQSALMAEYAYNILGVNTAAAIHDGDVYTEGLAKTFATSFEALGGKMIAFSAINKGTTDMSPLLSGIVEKGNVQFLYFPLYTEECVILARQAKEISDLAGTYLATSDACFSDVVAEALGESGQGMLFSGPDLSFSGNDYVQFVKRYNELFGTNPISIFHAHAFDAANMVFACIEQIGELDNDGTLHIGRQDLRDCLYATTDFAGITGIHTCNQYGDCGNEKIKINILTNGYFSQIWP